MCSAAQKLKSNLRMQLQQLQTFRRSKNRLKNYLQFLTSMKLFDSINLYHLLYKNKFANLQTSKTPLIVAKTTKQSFTSSLFLHCDIRRHLCRRPSFLPFYTSFSSVLPYFFYFILILSLLQQKVICLPSSLSLLSASSSIVSAPESVIASLNSSGALSASATELPPPLTFSHHHHRSHLHLSKLFFPLATSSFPLESSFKSSSTTTTSQPKQSSYFRGRQSSLFRNDSLVNQVATITAHRNPVSQKRKRELFALTISETEPLKTLRPGNAFWSTSSGGGRGGGAGSRRRRMSALHGGPHGGKVLKPPYSVFNPLSAFSSSSSSAAMAAGATNAAAAAATAAAAAGNMRMKIMLPPPPGFGIGLRPDQKCNFEVYPSGCFDENGSICDTSGSNLCVCRPGYSIRIASIYCLRPASIGEACYTTEQCERKVQYSGCFSYREEYREENPSAFFGPSQSSWPMGECRCRTGHRYDQFSKSCVRSLIGSWCSNVWDCQMVEEGDGGAGGPNGVDGLSTDEGQMSSLRQSSSSHNHTRHQLGLPVQMLPWHSGPSLHGLHGTRAKMTNIVCENKVCSCSPFFHYNSTAEECQYVETYGQPCRPSSKSTDQLSSAMLSASGRSTSGKRSTRTRGSGYSSASGIYELSSRRHSSSPPFSSSSSSSLYHYRQRRSLGENEVSLVGGGGVGGLNNGGPLVSCTLPTVCSINGSCVCAEGFEYQAGSSPQCQGVTHHGFHKGEKNSHSGSAYERGFEGHSNVGNFVEYVLYVLVPALIVILMFKPCFRRIGEWRTHIHQYNSDSDFYLAANAPVMAAGDCGNVIAVTGEKVLTGGGIAGSAAGAAGAVQYSTPFSAFSSHALTGCGGHAGPFLFESVDGCVYGGCLTSTMPPPNDPSLALVREKLQTIEETQSEDGGGSGGGGGGAGGSACNLNSATSVTATEAGPSGGGGGGCASCLAAMAAGDKQCCSWGHALIGGHISPTTCTLQSVTSLPLQSSSVEMMMMNGVHRESSQQLTQQQQTQLINEMGTDAGERGMPSNGCSGKGIIESKADGIEMIQFSKDQQQQQECSSLTDRELDHSKKEVSEMI